MSKQLKDVWCWGVKSLHIWENGTSKGIRDIITAPTEIRMVRAALIKVWCAHRSCNASWRGTSWVRLWVSSIFSSSRSWITLLTRDEPKTRNPILVGLLAWGQCNANPSVATLPLELPCILPGHLCLSVTLGRQTPAEETIHALQKLKEIILL